MEKELIRIIKNDSRIIIEYDELKELVERGLKDTEIEEILNVKFGSVSCARKRYKIIREPIRGGRVEPTQRQWNIISGSLLGDMNLTKVTTNSWGKSEYSRKFKDYCNWMYFELRNLSGKMSNHDRFDSRTNKTYYSTSFHIKANPCLNRIYEETYINRRKIISDYLLSTYNELSLAVHFMDDGFKTYSGYCLATQCFNEESIERFQTFLKARFNLSSSLHKSKNIYFPASSRSLFEYLITPYLHPIMRYKLVSRNSVNSVEA